MPGLAAITKTSPVIHSPSLLQVPVWFVPLKFCDGSRSAVNISNSLMPTSSTGRVRGILAHPLQHPPITMTNNIIRNTSHPQVPEYQAYLWFVLYRIMDTGHHQQQYIQQLFFPNRCCQYCGRYQLSGVATTSLAINQNNISHLFKWGASGIVAGINVNRWIDDTHTDHFRIPSLA